MCQSTGQMTNNNFLAANSESLLFHFAMVTNKQVSKIKEGVKFINELWCLVGRL